MNLGQLLKLVRADSSSTRSATTACAGCRSARTSSPRRSRRCCDLAGRQVPLRQRRQPGPALVRHRTPSSSASRPSSASSRARGGRPSCSCPPGYWPTGLALLRQGRAVSENGGRQARPADREGLQVRPGGALVPGLRRLRDPRRDAGLHARARHPAREDRLHLRDRLRGALPLLHADLRDALDPRARAGDRDRARPRPGRTCPSGS